jgi:hypothetical protein
MKRTHPRTCFFLIYTALFFFWMRAISFAVVGETTLTGFPPNTVVTLTNQETGEKTDEKSDDRGKAPTP